MKKEGAFSARVMIALTLVSVFAFSAMLTLASFAPEWTSGDDGRGHALSRSATGYAGIVRLTRETGRVVLVSRTRGARAQFAVITPESPLNPEQIGERVSRTALIVLPKWLGAADRSHKGWVSLAGRYPPDLLELFVHDLASKARVVRSTDKGRVRLRFVDEGVAMHDGGVLETGAIDGLQTLEGEGLAPIIMTTDGRTLLARVRAAEKEGKEDDFAPDEPAIYILSDPDLINTMGMGHVDTARSGLTIVNALALPGEPIVFDVTLNGFESARSLMRMALSPPFLAATLCLVAAAFLLGWRAAVRAGPAEREARAIALGKRALADNAAALIRNARRETHMGWPYALIAANKTAERLAPARRRHEDLVAFLDRMSAARGAPGRYSDLVSEASAAETRAGLLAAAQKLHDWMKEMLRASG